MGATAGDECRRRGRPRKNRRHRARRSSPPRRRSRRFQYYEDEDDSEVELELDRDYEEEEIEDGDDSDGGDEDERHRLKKKLKLLVKLHRHPTPPPPPPFSGDEDEDDGEVYEWCTMGTGRSGGDRKVERRREMDRDFYGGSAHESGTPLPDGEMLESILEKIQKKDRYNVFAEPVDLDELPDYLEVIEHPMDFSTIRRKIARGAYLNLEELESDVFLICTNAMQYNAPETIYHKQARSMQDVARKYFESVRAESRASENIPKPESNDFANSLEKKHFGRVRAESRAPENISKPEPNDFANSLERKYFGRVRAESRACENIPKPELNGLANSLEKNPWKISSTTVNVQEAAVSDTSSAAVAKTYGNDEIELPLQKNNEIEWKAAEATRSEKITKDSGPAVTDASFASVGRVPDKARKVEKVEEFSEKNTTSKGGQRLAAGDENHRPLDENRRLTYNISTEGVDSQPDSILSTFEAEKKQLVAVGLDAEYSYARSLARFASTLGPIAWKIASHKIKKALPDGVKFGRGWVGEYEPPIPMHVISVMESIPHTSGHTKFDRHTVESKEKQQNGELKSQHEAAKLWRTQGHDKLDRHIIESKKGKKNGELRVHHGAENIRQTRGSNKVDGYLIESREKQREVKADHVASSTDIKVGMPCATTYQSTGGLEMMPASNANKSKREKVDLEGRLGTFQFSSRQQPEVNHDIVQQKGDKLTGVLWKNRIINNAQVSVPKEAPISHSFSTCNDLSDSALRKPQFQLGAAVPGFLPSLGYKNAAKPESTEVCISRKQTPMSMNAVFPLKIDAAKHGLPPAEKKGVESSSIRDKVCSSGASTNNPHGNTRAAQVTIDSTKSRMLMPGSNLQNLPNSMLSSAKQFIPASSSTNNSSAGSVIARGNGGVAGSGCTSSSTPINSWISIGSCAEGKPAETAGFLKAQPEPKILNRPTSTASLMSGMYHQGKQPIPPSNPNATHGRPLFSLSQQMPAEKSSLQNDNPPSFSLMFTSSDMPRPRQMFPWRDLASHSQQRKSEDMLPPDLNLGFQSPGSSPVQRSPGVRVDSQPDLALQL